MDEFEKHIRENKDLFDDQVPTKDKMWQAIEGDLSSEKEKSSVIKLWQSRWFRIAASVLVLLCSGAVFLGGTQANDMAANKELDDINDYYSAIVKMQVAKLKDNEKLSATDKEEFLFYLQELDKKHKGLMEEMYRNIDNDIILQAIISNYRKRIELIENFLKKINKNNNIQENNGYIL